MTLSRSSSSELDTVEGSEKPNPDISTVGEIVGEDPSNDMNRVTVRWRTSDGRLNERTLTVAKGVSVAAGDLVLLQRPCNWPEWIVTQVIESLNRLTLPDVPEVIVDGKRVHIEAKEEIVLRCGKASITMRSNGRLVIRGTYIETRASGTNRIKGGSVLIN